MSLAKDIIENPWQKLQYELEDHISTWRGANKPYKTVNWINRIHAPSCLKLEMRRTDTGKTKKTHGISIGWDWNDNREDKYNDPPTVEWARFDRISPDLIEFRIEEKLLRRVQWLIENVNVGDFVLCKGTRSGDWNKVESISNSGEVLFGPKYTKPQEGFMRYASSDNHISKVAKIVSNGEMVKIP